MLFNICVICLTHLAFAKLEEICFKKQINCETKKAICGKITNEVDMLIINYTNVMTSELAFRCSQNSTSNSGVAFNAVAAPPSCQIFKNAPTEFAENPVCILYKLQNMTTDSCYKTTVNLYTTTKFIPTKGIPGPCNCSFTSPSSPWMVIQRRCDGNTDFYRNWTQYEKGFGRFDGEFWIGNAWLLNATAKNAYSLRIDMEDYDEITAWAEYAHFSIVDPEYRLIIGSYSGNAGDSLSFHNNRTFSTFDRGAVRYCATSYKGAWWYNSCHASNLNGQYLYGTTNLYAQGVVWSAFRGHHYSLKCVEMKIKLIPESVES